MRANWNWVDVAREAYKLTPTERNTIEQKQERMIKHLALQIQLVKQLDQLRAIYRHFGFPYDTPIEIVGDYIEEQV